MKGMKMHITVEYEIDDEGCVIATATLTDGDRIATCDYDGDDYRMIGAHASKQEDADMRYAARIEHERVAGIQ